MNNLELKELSVQEMKEANGGGYWKIIPLYYIYEVIKNPQAHWEAAKAGWEAGWS